MRCVGVDRWACGSGADRPLRDAGEREQAGASWAEVRAGAEPCWAGSRERVGLGCRVFLGLGSFSNPFPFYFFSFLNLNQTKFEFKYKFEFKLHSNN